MTRRVIVAGTEIAVKCLLSKDCITDILKIEEINLVSGEEIVPEFKETCEDEIENLEDIYYKREEIHFTMFENIEIVEQGHFDRDSANPIQSEVSNIGYSEVDKINEESGNAMDIETSIQDETYVESNNNDSDISEKWPTTESSSRYGCTICGKVYSSRPSMYRHRKKHENPKPYECTVTTCNKKFSNKTNRDDHVSIIHEKRIYTCPACDCQSKYRRMVVQHIHKVHGGTHGLQPIDHPKTR